ncbi:glutathione S-transferase [Cognaticolwellia aestuarii]|uniref:glutathione S-transferase n=1 Tax=Cognaticolwellia aestuarii TaxID=329993 RepID=UPI0009856E12|nr:glutathione S-transferase [Cognaticolwellia aestuarii]
MALPTLYSLRNCPYAMRARLAIFKSAQPVALRDVVLTNKPPEMVLASAKATVPVLVLNGIAQNSDESEAEVAVNVIDESLDIMLWSLKKSDPHDLLHSDSPETLSAMLALISDFDVEFKQRIEAYKCAKRYHEDNLVDCRIACEAYIKQLEARLTQHEFLFSAKESLADIALLPFIRQFARIERQWYLQSPYPNLKRWLNNYLQSSMFTKVMAKHPLWLDSGEEVVFAGPVKNE